ncbi:hypothetical protein [Paraburkholderia tropica]|uniref:hypothetical protein n=1 Tax=Paraburkholderia tropica TaxID=92647 RepID=UPI003D27EBFC
MTIDLDKLEDLAKAAQRGEVSWSFGPSQTLELIAEVRRLSGIVEKYIDPKEVRLTGMHPIGGALHIGLEGGACKIFAESFAEQFRESGATNYVEMTLESNDAEIGELLVTLQRVQGKTPAQLRREAEAERNALRDDAERLRAELHDFTTQCGELNEEVVRLRENSLMSGMDLLGVIVDVEQGHGFDDVCLNTIKRVSKMLGNASRGAE